MPSYEFTRIETTSYLVVADTLTDAREKLNVKLHLPYGDARHGDVRYWPTKVEWIDPAPAPVRVPEDGAAPGIGESRMCRCGHSHSWHQKNGRCGMTSDDWSGGCLCREFRPAPVPEDGAEGPRDWLADVREVLAYTYEPERVEAWLDATGDPNDETLLTRRVLIEEEGMGAQVLRYAELAVGLTLDEVRDRNGAEGAECSCAMTEESMRRCPLHGEDEHRACEGCGELREECACHPVPHGEWIETPSGATVHASFEREPTDEEREAVAGLADAALRSMRAAEEDAAARAALQKGGLLPYPSAEPPVGEVRVPVEARDHDVMPSEKDGVCDDCGVPVGDGSCDACLDHGSPAPVSEEPEVAARRREFNTPTDDDGWAQYDDAASEPKAEEDKRDA